MDKNLSSELKSELQRCECLINSHVLEDHNSLFIHSAFTEILIRLNYILQKLSINKLRINVTEDVDCNNEIKDITDLVNKIRNAACHMDSSENYIGSMRFVFNSVIGKIPHAFLLPDGSALGCDYEDDIAYYYGNKRIYLNRHIRRLIIEINKLLNGIT